MKIYVAGPMRGVPDFNFPAFIAATVALRTQGHEVFNPAERDLMTGFDPTGLTGFEDFNGTHRFDLREALGDDVEWIAANAEAICLLPGWESSYGARAEMALAAALSLKAGYLGDFLSEATLPDASHILSLQPAPNYRPVPTPAQVKAFKDAWGNGVPGSRTVAGLTTALRVTS